MPIRAKNISILRPRQSRSTNSVVIPFHPSNSSSYREGICQWGRCLLCCRKLFKNLQSGIYTKPNFVGIAVRNRLNWGFLHVKIKVLTDENEKDMEQKNQTEETLQEHYEECHETVQKMTLMDDIFIRNVLKDPACTETILQTILEQQELRVKGQVIQKDYKNLQGRSAVLDCVAETTSGRLLNIEIQQEKDGASPKRVRYYSGLLDMNKLKPGQKFEELPKSDVILITRGDVLGYQRPIYHIWRTIHEVSEDFTDESSIIYVNAENEDETTELGRLMHDFRCRKASELYNPILAKRVWELKETEKGLELMSEIADEIYNSGIKRGVEKGKREMAKEMVYSLLEEGMPVEKISRLVKVDISQVQKWIAEASLVPVG